VYWQMITASAKERRSKASSSSMTAASATHRRPGASAGHPPRSSGPEKAGTAGEESCEVQPAGQPTAESCECVSCMEHLPRECHRSLAAGAEAMEVLPGAVNTTSHRVMVCTACAKRMRARYDARFVASRVEAVRSGQRDEGLLKTVFS
jgi:hypothetical protein